MHAAMTCPTVKIKTADGHCVINESDFDAAVHERFVEVPPPPVAVIPPPPPGPPDPLDAMVGNWQAFDPAKLRQVAAALSGRAVENKAQAVQVIQAALKARGK